MCSTSVFPFGNPQGSRDDEAKQILLNLCIDAITTQYRHTLSFAYFQHYCWLAAHSYELNVKYDRTRCEIEKNSYKALSCRYQRTKYAHKLAYTSYTTYFPILHETPFLACCALACLFSLHSPYPFFFFFAFLCVFFPPFTFATTRSSTITLHICKGLSEYSPHTPFQSSL